MIVESIVAMLTKEGLGLLAGAVKGGGEKIVEKIEKKTGIDIKDVADPATETVLTPEHVEKLKEFETSKVLDLAKIVAGADQGKWYGIVLAGIADEIPELILFGVSGVAVVAITAIELYMTKTIKASAGFIGTWLGGFAMYVKGK